jgi:PHD/YefM family antitoxin component YafN of YafNO toxin-antitoxin module
MKFITVTELKLKATQIVAEIEASKELVVITKMGKPVVIMGPVTGNSFILKETGKGART